MISVRRRSSTTELPATRSSRSSRRSPGTRPAAGSMLRGNDRSTMTSGRPPRRAIASSASATAQQWCAGTSRADHDLRSVEHHVELVERHHLFGTSCEHLGALDSSGADDVVHSASDELADSCSCHLAGAHHDGQTGGRCVVDSRGVEPQLRQQRRRRGIRLVRASPDRDRRAKHAVEVRTDGSVGACHGNRGSDLTEDLALTRNPRLEPGRDTEEVQRSVRPGCVTHVVVEHSRGVPIWSASASTAAIAFGASPAR